MTAWERLLSMVTNGRLLLLLGRYDPNIIDDRRDKHFVEVQNQGGNPMFRVVRPELADAVEQAARELVVRTLVRQ